MQTLLPQQDVDKWREQGTELGAFMADMTDFYMEAYRNFRPGIAGCALHDPLAVGLAIDSSFCGDASNAHCRRGGRFHRGWSHP